MNRWVMTVHTVVHYARSPRSYEVEAMKSGGRQMRRRGTWTVYRIVVRSELSDKYAVAFEGMEMEARDGVTVLTGKIIDQPQLYGILERTNGLGLDLLSVEAMPDDAHQSAENPRFGGT
jgi:hypothetical protein